MCVCFYRAESEVVASRLRLKLNQLFVVLNDFYGNGKENETKKFMPVSVDILNKRGLTRLEYFANGRQKLEKQIALDYDPYERDQRENSEEEQAEKIKQVG